MKFALINENTGLVDSIIISDSYRDGIILHGYLYKKISDDVDNDTVLDQWHWKDGKFKIHTQRPTKHHIFNLKTEQWQEPEGYLETIRSEAVKQINQLAGQKITAVYPITKQNYLQGRYIELMMLGQTDSEEAKAIAAAWQFLKAVKDASDEANVRVNQADTLEAITAIVDEFKLFNL